MKKIFKFLSVFITIICVLCSCTSIEDCHEKIRNFINTVTSKTSDRVMYNETYDQATSVETEYYIYYDFQREECGLYTYTYSGQLSTGIQVIFPKSDYLVTTIYFLEYYAGEVVFKASATFNTSTFNYKDTLSFSTIYYADYYAKENLNSYITRLTLGVHVNLLSFETTLGEILNITLKDLGYKNYLKN